MSDSSRVQLAGIEEVTWGTTPASALAAIRYTTESLAHRKETTRSDEVRSDAQVTDIVDVGANADGGFDFEMSYLSHNIYYEGMFREDFSTDGNFSAATVDAAVADNSFNDSGSGFPPLSAGQWIYVTGFSDPANIGYFEVVSRTTGKIVVTGGILVTEAVGPTVVIHDSTLTNGVTEKSYSLEKFASDKTQYFGFTGCRIGSLSVSIASRRKVTGSFGVLGKQGALTQATMGSGAYTAANTNKIMNASANVGKLLEGGAALGAGVFIQSLEVEYNNNLRVIDGVGQGVAVEIGFGRFVVTGSYTALFEDEVLFDKYLASTESSLNVVVTDDDGNTNILSYPAIKYTDGDIVGGGNDGEVLADLKWEAKMHATQGVMARIDTFATV